MKTLAIAIKHMIALGADPISIQSFVDEVASCLDAVNSANRDREKAYERDRKRAYREAMSQNVPMSPESPGQKKVTKEKVIYINPGEGECEGENPVPDTGNQRRTKNILEQRFLEFWTRYPKKSGKGAARSKFLFAIKKATSTQIMEGLDRYIASKPDPQFTKNPATWLHQECWLDEYDKPKGVVLAGPWKEVKPEPPQKPMTPEEKARREEQIARLRPGSIKDTLRKSLEREESFEEEQGE
jgi:hypothetical protein